MPIYRMNVRLTNSILGGQGSNTWHLRTLEATPLFDDLDLLSEYIRVFYNGLEGSFAAGTEVYFNGEYTGVGPDEGSSATGATWAVNSTTTGDPLPPFCCVCVSWEGAAGDRSKRGRTFFGPIDQSVCQSNGTMDDGYLAAWRAAANTLIDASEDFDNGAIGIWSRQESVLRDFVSAHISDQFASLRSRRD